MGNKLHLPDGSELRDPEPDALFIVQQLGNLLVGIQRQLEALIQIESGFLPKAEVKRRYVAAEAAARKLEAEAEAEVTEAMAKRESAKLEVVHGSPE